ncbi:hypothetical protein ABK040_002812 [Willaertia magna]
MKGLITVPIIYKLNNNYKQSNNLLNRNNNEYYSQQSCHFYHTSFFSSSSTNNSTNSTQKKPFDISKLSTIEAIFQQLIKIDMPQVFERIQKFNQEMANQSLLKAQSQIPSLDNQNNIQEKEIKLEPISDALKQRILKSLELLVSLPDIEINKEEEEEQLIKAKEKLNYIKSQSYKLLSTIYSNFYKVLKVERDPHLAFYYMLLSSNYNDPEANFLIGEMYSDAFNFIAGKELEPEKFNYIKSTSFLYGTEFEKETGTYIYLDEKSRKRKLLKSQLGSEALSARYKPEEYLKNFPGLTKSVLNIRFKESEKLAVEYYLKAADLGDVEAQVVISRFYLEGKGGVSANLKKAFHYTELAAKQDSYLALFNLASMYFVGMRSTVPKDGFEHLTDTQLQQTPDSTEMFEVKKDVSLAMEYFKKSASFGSAEANYFVGNSIHHGINTMEQNTEKALEYLNKAISLGHGEAAYYVYCMYKTGDKCKQDVSLSEKYFKTAIQLQSSNALYELADRYFHGKEGNPVDYEKAFQFYQLAGERKNRNALYCLGVMYYNGIYVQKNLRLAYERYTQAAALNSKEAFLAMSDMVAKGESVPKDEHYAQQLRKAYERLVEAEGRQ